MLQRKALEELYRTWFTKRQVAEAMMSTGQLQRSAQRTFVRLPAWITLDARPREHVAFVRDISPRGIFFYSDFLPTSGDRLDFILEYLRDSNKVRLHLNGRVVRLEQTHGSNVGIALAFDASRSDVTRVVRSGQKQ